MPKLLVRIEFFDGRRVVKTLVDDMTIDEVYQLCARFDSFAGERLKKSEETIPLDFSPAITATDFFPAIRWSRIQAITVINYTIANVSRIDRSN